MNPVPGVRIPAGRADFGAHLLAPGEYWYQPGDGWYGCSPNGLLAALRKHAVTEHEDGTITVEPSVLVSDGQGGNSWHGYLKRGVWKEC